MTKKYMPSRASCPPERRYLGTDAIPGAKTALTLLLALSFGLWLDHFSPLWGQVAAGVLFWGLFCLFYHKTPQSERPFLMSCLLVATVGEVFCSLIWQLYDYRFYNIPHYVPPGHVLVFLLGSSIAPKMPKFIVWMVPLLTAPYIISAYLLGFDQFGLLLYLMFLACLLVEEDRRLYATMFMLCLLLEIYGTFLGNWSWKARVPVWDITTTNPPLASGAFYCVLDFLMLRLILAYRPGRLLFAELAFNITQQLASIIRNGKSCPPELEIAPKEVE